MKDFEQHNLDFAALGYVDPSKPPTTRDECEHIQRPCVRSTCRHNLLAETEIAGKPHEGRHTANRLRVLPNGAESCALDVAAKTEDRDEHGRLSHTKVGEHLGGISGARVRQIAVRGGVKLLARSRLEDMLEELRSELARHGVKLELEYLESCDADAMTAVVVFDIPKMGPAPSGVTVRRRAT